MSFQETILELFENRRIDKSVAYRLLRDIKTHALAAPEPGTTTAPATSRRLTLTLPLPADPDWRLMLVVYLLHLVQGKETVTLALRTDAGDRVIHTRVDEGMTPAELLEAVRSQRLDDRRLFERAPFIWVNNGVQDGRARQITFHERPDPASTDVWLVEVRLREHAEGVTRPDDWQECLLHWDEVFSRERTQPFSSLDRLPPRHKQLLKRYNNTDAYVPATRTLPTLLDPVLQRYSAHDAILASSGSMNYEAYASLAWRLAHQLRAHGAGRHQVVAVMLQRSATLPAALYGVICAGAAYVPLEADMPDERVRIILQDTGATLLLTDADTLLQRTLPLDDTAVAGIVCTDDWPRRIFQDIRVGDARARMRFPATPPPPVNEPDDLSYVIYTSGSTGRPKGVMISHASLVNSLIGLNNVFHVHPGDRFMAFSSYGFDLSIWDFFGAALAGAAVILPDQQERQDPAAMWKLMHDHQATLWNSVPTAMNQLMIPFHEGGIEPLPSLRLAMLGGEFITPALMADISRAFPNCVVSNGGGATEGTIYSIYCHPVTGFLPGWKNIPYGVPLPNQHIHVLNDEMRPCAIGEKGMIWIGGLGVAQGYLGDPDKTAAAFLPAPWSEDPDERIYRTGDIGIMRADGMVDFCGRQDRQVKLRGYRIELGEIESALGTHDGIEQCAVVVQRAEGQSPRLVAYYVSHRDDLQESALREHLGSRLPGYMVPDQIQRLENDPPLNASGKLDHLALTRRATEAAARTTADASDAADEGGPSVEARGLEGALASELANILRIKTIGPDDDFFLMGGDSLLTLQYISALGRLGLSATPQDIQQGRSIRGVLARVKALAQEESRAGAMQVGLTPMGRKFFERLPLVDRDHWQQLLVIRFDHLPDMERLNQAMTRVHAQHPLLRARWDGQQLAVPEAGDVEIQHADLGHTPRLLRPIRVNRLVADLREEAGLDGDCLSGALLVRFSDSDARLYWVLHHLIVDANCWRTLVDDLATCYRRRQARLLATGSVQSLVDTVTRHVDDAIETLRTRPVWTRMPIPRRRGRTGTGLEGDSRTLRDVYSKQDTRRMYAALQGETNLNLLLLSALSLALRQWARQEDVRFDVISNGRSVDDALDLSRSIGWFATHNPFQVKLGDARPGRVLSAVSKAWQRYQADAAWFVAACNEAHRQDLEPLAGHVDQALLYSFLGDFDSLSLPDGWQIAGSHGRNRGSSNPRTHETEMEALVADGRLMLRLVYSSSQLHRSQARALLKHFRHALDRLIHHLEHA